MNRVSIIILNWNNWEHTIRCLATLFQSTYENYNVILVENGSRDISLQNIRKWAAGRLSAATKIFPEDPDAKPSRVYEQKHSRIMPNQAAGECIAKSLTIIEIDENIGFARGCNLGITYALRDKTVKYILTLNNDMEISKDCVSLLAAQADADESIGACQGKVLLSESPGFIDGAGVNVTWYGAAFMVGHGEADHGQYNKITKIFGAYPATALFRRKMLDDIGLFDEDFFVYYEDVDLCLRSRRSGWTTVLVPSAVTYHFHSASYGKDSPQKLYYIFRNLLFYAIKDLPFPSLIIFLALYYPATVLTYIVKTRADKEAFKSIMHGAKDGLTGIPHSWEKRQALSRPLPQGIK
ncbi:MAG: glycosyltransferase family 2 protein [Candidatus Omnitrophica bacterium]|nr:glycosyltransferase family 2 protein [Candidatus Omnitrophota bacterium]